MLEHRSEHWESGSEFHWLTPEQTSDTSPSWGERGIRYGSGRDAFRALLHHGQADRGWRRLWIPSYFCQEVAHSFLSTGIEVAVYSDSPKHASCDYSRLSTTFGDVVLWVNLFGLRTSPGFRDIDRAQVEIIEDHTHDPFSEAARSSDADWCIASLRKTLPLPDGGVLWSPIGHSTPRPVAATLERQSASLKKLTAMVLKAMYLRGDSVEKRTFRDLATSGENSIATGEISGMPEWSAELITKFPVEKWRQRRRSNHRVLSQALVDTAWISVLQPAPDALVCPFSGILVFDSSERRDQVRQRLIASRVYPAILWPLERTVVDNIPQEHTELSRRMLSVHCDMRYSASEMEHVASLIRKFGSE